MNKILITGCAGFIGYHLANKLLNEGYEVFGIDNINNYYDVDLKIDRLKELKKNKKFQFNKIDIKSKLKLGKIFYKFRFKIVYHLAAQAGVRFSINNPDAYFESNIHGFFNMIELSKNYKVKHFIFASSSSVYGDAKYFPTDESANTDKPLSFYAASKKTNEVMAYSYSNIYKLKCTGLRFFTVYGPLGRPDMALFKFVNNIYNNKKISLFNNGNHKRDFTYIDDVIYSMIKIMNKKINKKIPYTILNIGGNDPKNLNFFLKIISKYIGKKPSIKFLDKQKGDVKITHADNKKLIKLIGNYKKTSLNLGIKKFVSWYQKKYIKKS